MSDTNPIQERIFQSIVHHEADKKYIHVDEKGVALKFPLKITIDFSVDGKQLTLERYQKKELFKFIKMLLESDLKTEGFECMTEFSEDVEVVFNKATSDFCEARTAVKWALRCLRHFGI